MSNPIKLLLVDDSSLVRKVVKSLFKDDAEIEVVAEAEDGAIALEKIKTTDLDLVLLDYEMPNMTGIELLKALRADKTIASKPPVIVFSSLTNTGSKQTIECLLAGAKDYIAKPSRSIAGAGDLNELKKTLKDKILSIASGNKNKEVAGAPKAAKPSIPKPTEIPKKPNLKLPGLVVIGSSTGGPAALEVVLKKVPANFPYPILIVQHMPANFTAILAETLTKNTPIKVNEVNSETKLEKGQAYIAAGGFHMVMKDIHTVDSVKGEPVNFCIPSVDVLFESVAKVYNKSVLSVMLTGMGKDGRDGVAALKKSLDCYSIAQDEETSVVWAMPKVVYEAGLSDALLPLDEIGGYISHVGHSSTVK